MSELLEEFSEYELVCDSGDGTRIKVRDIGLLIFDSDLPDNGRTTLHENHPYFEVHYIVFGGGVLDDMMWEESPDIYYQKGTPEFNKILKHFITSMVLT